LKPIVLVYTSNDHLLVASKAYQ